MWNVASDFEGRMPRFVDFFVGEWQAERSNHCTVQYGEEQAAIRQVELAEDVSFESGGTLRECHPVSVRRGEVETR